MAKLATVALEMEDEARRRGQAYRKLARGLELHLAWCAGQKALTLSRSGALPGEMEITICRDLFRVPPDAGREDGNVSVTLRWPI